MITGSGALHALPCAGRINRQGSPELFQPEGNQRPTTRQRDEDRAGERAIVF